jgi:SWI/SNF-related matrix-associated actin-dependent regulator of chromatin subfamily A containing DEAD/H box 1
MMTPFVLRRRKDQVLRDLPKKTERVQLCSLSATQTEIYRDALKRSHKALEEMPDEAEPVKKKTRSAKTPQAKQPADTSSNVLMDLRKAALHPMLFRKRFTDSKVKTMAKDCLKEPEFAESNYDYVVEDMSVMSDAELQLFCEKYKVTYLSGVGVTGD